MDSDSQDSDCSVQGRDDNDEERMEQSGPNPSEASCTSQNQVSEGTPSAKMAAKEEIQKLIAERSSRVSLRQNCSRSDVWTAFKIVYLDQKKTTFVKCNTCIGIYVWVSGTGTSSLRKHLPCNTGKNKSSASSQPISMLLPKPVPENSKRALNRAIVLGLAKDMRPLSTVNGLGFANLAQALVNFGSRHGQVNVQKVIYDRTTLKRSLLPEVVADVKLQVVQNLRAALVPSRMAFTMDLWTEKYRSRHFLSLTAHFVDNEFALRRELLGVEEFPYEKRSTVNVRSECSRILRAFFTEHEVSELLANGVSVTDTGSNVTRVFKWRKPCQCHKEHNFLDSLFSPSDMKNKFPELDATMTGIKDLVTFAKRSGFNKDLPVSLKQAVTTRWCSELTMIKSFLKSADALRETLDAKRELNRLDKVDHALALAFASFLEPFDKCFQALQADKYPTIHLVALWFNKLREHLTQKDDDTSLFKKIKEEAKPIFKRYIITDDFYLAACSLNPLYRKLKFATQHEREQARKFLKELVLKEKLLEKASGEVEDTPNKRKRDEADQFATMMDSDDEESAEGQDEVDIYLSMPIPAGLDKDDPNFLLKFWMDQKKLPKLRQVASWMLAVPASSASDERVFSATGHTMNPRRTQLEGSTLADMTFLHFNAL